MKRFLVSISLITVMITAFSAVSVAQSTHLAGQATGSFNRDVGYGAPNVGAELSGAFVVDRVTLFGSVGGERAVKDFKTNGTNIGLNVGARFYPFKFLFAEGGYDQAGQYNNTYVQVGHSYFAGGGFNFKNRFIIGADYVSNDGTVAQVTKARIHGDVYKSLSTRLALKLSAVADFRQVNAGLSPAQALDPRNFAGQGLKLGVGFALK